MSKVKAMVADKAELALTGRVVTCGVQDTSEAQAITDYILQVLYGGAKKVDVDSQINRYVYGEEKHKVYGLSVNKVDDMLFITYILQNDSEDPELRVEPMVYCVDGLTYSFCWTENLSFSDYSELGDVCFEKRADNFYYRDY